MNVKSQGTANPTQAAPDQGHPAWCDRSQCTADPASQADGYNSRTGGQHRSADLPLNLRAGMWPIPPHAVVYLSEAVAPWRCSTYLRIVVDRDTELSMPVDSAAPLLAALSELVASALTETEAR
ncbi:hypothetical protein GCM10017581_086570 [Dactylosporangium matsuzakiense]|uniref:Uncharacterized protein n=1 Tax=Dactylosporangium matsuzakiense TaxID=53360 RepID=A0A9W6KTH5_9ACTN|nr:hypothetical protein GCM10017581_086570 [Dactylosporangium matsuzakiense]